MPFNNSIPTTLGEACPYKLIRLLRIGNIATRFNNLVPGLVSIYLCSRYYAYTVLARKIYYSPRVLIIL